MKDKTLRKRMGTLKLALALEFLTEVLSGAQLRYADFRERFAAGELLGKK